MEYFAGMDLFRIIEADENPNIYTSNVANSISMNEWLTFISGADPVLNVAVGYSWIISQDLWLMTGFRTDYNYINHLNYDGFDAGKSSRDLQQAVY